MESTGRATPHDDSLLRVSTEVGDCRACPRLVEWREAIGRKKRAAYRDDTYWARGVPGFGDPDAHLVVVGLAPAAHGANRTGRMFTGDRSGDWLYRGLWRAGYANQPESVSIDDGMELTGAFITSPVKCAPPANKPTPDERRACQPFFARELALLDSCAVIVALGGIGYTAVAQHLGIKPRPKFGHGVEVPTTRRGGADGAAQVAGPTILCSYHVSQQNTFTGRLTEEMLDSVFARARELGEGGR